MVAKEIQRARGMEYRPEDGDGDGGIHAQDEQAVAVVIRMQSQSLSSRFGAQIECSQGKCERVNNCRKKTDKYCAADQCHDHIRVQYTCSREDHGQGHEEGVETSSACILDGGNEREFGVETLTIGGARPARSCQQSTLTSSATL